MSFHARLEAETAAQREHLLARPLLRRALAGAIDVDTYVAFLAQAYHHVRHTVPLLMAAGSRLPPGREWLRPALARYIDEEQGHEEWVLDDIRACGRDAQAVRDAQPGVAAELLVAYAYHVIDRGNPVGIFGMVHVLEGTSVALAGRAARAIAGATGLPPGAFGYLRSHGALDAEHVQFFAGLMDRLQGAGDQRAVIHCARVFYHLYGGVFDGLQAAPVAACDDCGGGRELGIAG